MELSRVIDPYLTWKTASRGRKRAVRRARTDFSCINWKKAPTRKEIEDPIDNDTKNTRDLPVSESEKLGVSILGRRFSETLESVPIKKRRFLLDQSSLPHQSSSQSDVVDHSLNNQPASYQDTLLQLEDCLPDTKSGYIVRNSADVKSDVVVTNKKSCDAADFSGISMLAAAACDDNVGDDSMITEASVSKEHSSGEQDIALKSSNSHFLTEKKEELLPRSSDGSVGRTDLPLELCASTVLPSKELNDINSDGSCNWEMSMNSLPKVSNRAFESASRDVKFNWDLNTVMDVWESDDDEVLNSEPCSTNVGAEGSCNENSRNVETCHGQVGIEDTKNDSDPVDSKVHLFGETMSIDASQSSKMAETLGVVGDFSAAGDNDTKTCFSVPHIDNDAKDEPQSEEPSLSEHPTSIVADISAETNPAHAASRSCAFSWNFPSPIGRATVSFGDSSLSSAAGLEEETAEQHCKSFSSETEAENTSSFLVLCDIGVKPTVPHLGEAQGVIKAPSAENTDATSLAGQENHSEKCCQTDVSMVEVTHRSHQEEQQESLCIDPDTDRIALQSLYNHLAEKTPEVLVDGNICGIVATAGVEADENVHDGVQIEADITRGVDAACDDECKKVSAEMKADSVSTEMKIDRSYTTATKMRIVTTEISGGKCHLLTGESLNDIRTELHDHVESVALRDKSTVIRLGVADALPENGAMTSQKFFRNYKDGYASCPGQLQDHLDSDYSDAFQNDTAQVVGMEKLECLVDDDSQYEDGEFRQQDAGCYFDDGAEEGETEHVDYGSVRETNIYEAASDLATSVNPPVNNGAYLDTSCGITYTPYAGKDPDHLSSILNCPLMADGLNSGAGKKDVVSVIEKGVSGHPRTEDGSNVKDALKSSAADSKVIGDNGFHNVGDGARELNHLTSSRMKTPGWDQLPGGCRSSVRSYNDAPLDESVGSEPARRVVGSSMRDLSSRMGRAQSSDCSHRNDKSYMRTSRSKDQNDFNSQVEGDAGAAPSVRRNRSFLQLQGKDRGDHWVDSKHHDNSRHDSSGYYSPPSFSHPATRSAAAATVAKLESNGFVVAPDGTIVKASAVGYSGRLVRGSAKAPSQNTHRSPMGRGSVIDRDRAYPPGRNHSREMSPDMSLQVGQGRADRYGPRTASMGHRGRYHTHNISDDIVGSPSPINHPISRSDRSFSPRRRSLHPLQCRSRSPARSRARSPSRWTPPRGRNDGAISCSTNQLWRERKSPNFISEAKMDKARPDSVERRTNYAPPRNRSSPPRSSRWIDGRKELPEHFRGHVYRRCSGRSPPPRVFSWGQKYDSSGGSKPAEFYRPVHSGKFAEFGGFNRESRNDGRGDNRRAHGDSYQMSHRMRHFDNESHRMRQFDNECNMKQCQYDDKDGFRSHDPQPKLSEFQQGDRREFDQSIERQLGDSSWRFKEENGQFREERDGEHNVSFKPFENREGNDDLDARGRP